MAVSLRQHIQARRSGRMEEVWKTGRRVNVYGNLKTKRRQQAMCVFHCAMSQFMSSLICKCSEQDTAVSSVPHQGSHPGQQSHRHTQEYQQLSGADRPLLLPSLQASSWEVLCRPPGCLLQGTGQDFACQWVFDICIAPPL